MIFDKLKQFRQSAYTLLGKGKDAVCGYQRKAGQYMLQGF